MVDLKKLDWLRDEIAILANDAQEKGIEPQQVGIALYAFAIGIFDLTPEREQEMKLRLLNVLQESGYLEKEPAS